MGPLPFMAFSWLRPMGVILTTLRHGVQMGRLETSSKGTNSTALWWSLAYRGVGDVRDVGLTVFFLSGNRCT